MKEEQSVHRAAAAMYVRRVRRGGLYGQEAQLSQRGRAMLSVVEHFAKSVNVNVIRNYVIK